tara:strand:- start:8216 stop:8758 length:543 start_codon:yes stop_codon:yes gene_type:complete
LETIQRHDKNNIVKIISVDSLRDKYEITELIHSVPALIPKLSEIIKKEDILYGKQVFDHLLLPNRGALFTQDNNTRLNKNIKDSTEKETFSNDDKNKEENDEPMAFTLGSSMSDNFSSLDENSDNLLKDKVYKWDLLSNDNTHFTDNENTTSITPISTTNDADKLPSLEELLNKRSQEVL